MQIAFMFQSVEWNSPFQEGPTQYGVVIQNN